MCVSDLLYNVNKYEGPHWSLSPSDVTLRLDSVGLGLSRAYNGTMVFGTWRPIQYSSKVSVRCVAIPGSI